MRIQYLYRNRKYNISNLKLLVADPPEISVETPVVFSGEGQEAMLVCIVHGDKLPDVSTITFYINIPYTLGSTIIVFSSHNIPLPKLNNKSNVHPIPIECGKGILYYLKFQGYIVKVLQFCMGILYLPHMHISYRVNIINSHVSRVSYL